MGGKIAALIVAGLSQALMSVAARLLSAALFERVIVKVLTHALRALAARTGSTLDDDVVEDVIKRLVDDGIDSSARS